MPELPAPSAASLRPKLSAAEAVARALSGSWVPDGSTGFSAGEREADDKSTERDEPPGAEPSAEAAAAGAPSTVPAGEPGVRKLTPGSPVLPVPDVAQPVRSLRLCGVRFRSVGPIHEFDCGDKSYERDEWVLVEADRGQRLGRVVVATQRGYVLGPANKTVRRALRRARPDEVQSQGDSASFEAEAYRYCKERLRERRLPMKLVQVEATPGQKAVFFFASEERIDFRDLVRDLAQRLHVRIEMRQIGARDGAKIVGGIGSCGRELCCTTFLPAFQPVSIRMAKDQGMVLNPTKLAGQCGRLKCCLVYEHQTYKELGKGLPKVGKRVVTPAGPGRVVDLDILGQKVRVILEEAGGAQTYLAAEVRPMNPPGGPQGSAPGPGGPGPGPGGSGGDSANRVGGRSPGAGPAKGPQTRAADATELADSGDAVEPVQGSGAGLMPALLDDPEADSDASDDSAAE